MRKGKKKTKLVKTQKEMKQTKTLKHLNLSKAEDQFLQKVIVDVRNRGGLKEGKNRFQKAQDFPCKTIFFDVDNTLILFDNFIKGRKDLQTLDIKLTPKQLKPINISVDIAPHRKHIQLLKDFHKKGTKIVVWSYAGGKWGEQVCKALKLDKYVDLYLDKPEFYVDDLESDEWMGERHWVKDE